MRLHESERTCDGRELKGLEHAGPSRNGRLGGFGTVTLVVEWRGD